MNVLKIRLRHAESRESDAQVARQADEEKLTKPKGNVKEKVELQNLQASSNLSAHELTTDLTTVNEPMILVTARILELSTKLEDVAPGPDKRLETLAAVSGAQARVEGLVRSIVGPSVDNLNAFVDHAETELVNGFRVWSEGAYAGRRL